MNAESKLDSPIPLLRTARKLVQADLAAACEVSPATLSNVERGRIVVSSDLGRRIADELGCSPAVIDGADFSIMVTSGTVTINEVADPAAS
mgnify:CR=1 FL=1